jgi:hypothetical protein
MFDNRDYVNSHLKCGFWGRPGGHPGAIPDRIASLR